MESMQAMQTEQNSDKLQISLPEKRQSQFSDVEWRTRQLIALAEVFKESLTPECLAIYVESLADLSDDQIRLCFGRAVRGLEWFPKPSKLRELAGAEGSATNQDAEARAAWDTVIDFADRYVQSDVHGGYSVDKGCRISAPPQLQQRIVDTVRRTGGWHAYKCMTNDDFPFQQKRFFEEYKAWNAVEQIPPTNLLTEMPRLQLVAKPISSTPQLECEIRNASLPPAVKKVPEPPTRAQIRDRREMLRQQIASLAANRFCSENRTENTAASHCAVTGSLDQKAVS
jgi:hypothetical protein